MTANQLCIPLCILAVIHLGTCIAAFNPYASSPKPLVGAHEVTLQDVVFIVRSQLASPHVERARRMRDDVQQQCRILGLGKPDIFLLHDKYGSPYSGHWTIFPVLSKIYKEYESKKWFFFSEEDTRISVRGVLAMLSRFSSEEDWFLGKGLFDQEATIIHHFRFHDSLSEFIFPDFDAGWVLSKAVMQSLVSRLDEDSPSIDFSIDVKHEVAHYIWNEERGVHLIGVPQLCAGNVDHHDNKQLTDKEIREKMEASDAEESVSKSAKKSLSICVTASPKSLPECGKPVSQKKILFAVKTCEKFHKERVPIVQQTWGRFAEHIVYFSDREDESIPTVDTGVPNTERGHCGKTFAILEQFLNSKEYKQFSWLVIADDDTIMSVARLRRLLSCYDTSQPILLGERYGYGHVKGHGYDYITGGGGMVFSRAAVDRMLSAGCRCSKIEDPDDMIIGMCAKRNQIPVTHSPLFHQARPADYAKGLLAHQTPVSFHKHWNVDPLRVYSDWFQEADAEMHNSVRDEL